jgi:hypothetical protein
MKPASTEHAQPSTSRWWRPRKERTRGRALFGYERHRPFLEAGLPTLIPRAFLVPQWTRSTSLGGDCRFIREIRRGIFPCAVLSVRANLACADGAIAQRAVSEVWESCFNDTRSFDEVDFLSDGPTTSKTYTSIDIVEEHLAVQRCPQS